MAFKTFAPGVLTSSDVNTFLMRQAVITCTSSTRPASPSEGMTIYETDTDALAIYTGSAWKYRGYYENYTPTVGGSLTLGNGSVIGRFAVVGDVVHLKGALLFGSTTSVAASGNALIGWPAGYSFGGGGTTGTADSRRGQSGLVRLQDTSLGDFRLGCTLPSSSIILQHYGVISSDIRPEEINTTAFTSWTWAAGDIIRWSITYEAA